MSRQQQLEEWKAARKSRQLGPGQASSHVNAGARQQQLGQPAKPPAPSLAARLPRGPVVDKENAVARAPVQGAAGGEVRQGHAADAVRKALPDSHKQQLESTFDSLQERMKALKRDSMRPATSSLAAAAGAGPAVRMHLPPGAPPAVPPSLAATRPHAEGEGAGNTSAAAGAGLGGFGGIAARLECLKRESYRPSVSGAGAAQQVQFESAGPVDCQGLTKLALQLFEDEQFKQLCDKGLNAQLTRSKDGATQETKIQELADIVKLLRRGMKDLQTRANEFIAASCKFEREVAQQVHMRRTSAVLLFSSHTPAAAALQMQLWPTCPMVLLRCCILRRWSRSSCRRNRSGCTCRRTWPGCAARWLAWRPTTRQSGRSGRRS